MKASGVINRKGTLLDNLRTKDIRKHEAELRHIENAPKSQIDKKFNLKEKLNH